MIWCRFEVEGEKLLGIVEGDVIRAVKGDMFGEHEVTSHSYPLSSAKLLVPVVPTTFYCVGLNYSDHISKMAAKRQQEPVFPQRPEIGYRSNSALVAHEGDILKPRDSGPQFQYEGELVVVIGKSGKNLSKADALDIVFGWTIGNDVSERSWQREDRTLWRSKNSDTFKPMGPWIVTDLDTNSLITTIRLNGQVTDSFATNAMIFDVPTYISEISRYITLQPGDVIWMGTDGTPENMVPGDVVEVEISGIGTLRNRVVAEL